MMTDGSEDNSCITEKKIYFRHSCRTHYIGCLNKILTEEQIRCIGKTPFGWMTKLKDGLKISRNLLNELIHLWVERRRGFFISGEVVRFCLLDVCLGLGLRVVGPIVDLNKGCEDSECRKHFDDENVDVKMVYEFVSKRHEELTVDDFCRLYVLIGLCEFLLPSRSGRVFPVLFNIVDNLGRLGNYNWGSAVYEYLVGSLCSASFLLRDDRDAKYFHVDGCVYLLQLWAFEHLLIWKTKGLNVSNQFPRLLHWMDVKVGDSVVSRSLKKKPVFHEVAVSEEELRHYVVEEAFQEYGRGFGSIDWNDDGGGFLGEKEQLKREILQQEQVISDLKQSILKLKEKMTGRSKVPPKEYFPSVDVDVSSGSHAYGENEDLVDDCGHEDDEGRKSQENDDLVEKSNMYTRMKNEPRTRLKSVALKTPFQTYFRRRVKK